MTSLGELDFALRLWWHLRRVVDEQLFADLIADPEFGFVRRQGRSMSPMRDLLFSGEDAVRDLAGFQIDDVESDVISETHVGVTILTVYGERKDETLAHVFDLADHFFVAGIKK